MKHSKKVWYAPNKFESYGEEEIKAVEECLRDVDDVEKARTLAQRLKEDKEFYLKCSNEAKLMYKNHYDIKEFKKIIKTLL